MSKTGVPLSEIADRTPGVTSVTGSETLVADITHDSRQVEHGTLFVAISGEYHDGHDFVPAALERGAVALLVDRPMAVETPQIVVEDTRVAMPWAASSVFGTPDADMTIVGVTGTNGKTTVAHMVESMLTVADTPAGLIGTLGARIGGKPLSLKRTTPEASDLQRMLSMMRDQAVEVVAMEVSSHATQLHRSDAIHFASVGFTNLTQDHLDFHGDMESYFAAKRKLFTPSTTQRAVINVDDRWGRRVAAETEVPHRTVGRHESADLRATSIVGDAAGTGFNVDLDGVPLPITLPLVGSFNVSNALVAIGLGMDIGIELDQIAAGLARLPTIAGRMEIVPHSGSFTAVVDYAHTPDAIAVVLASIAEAVEGRVIAVVGAGGDRDKDKRALMGSAAAKRSDITIVTTDNPRSESPELIADEVARGARLQGGAEVLQIIDRREAIRHAVAIAGEHDMVMILGRGHERGQEVAGGVVPFDDRVEVRSALEAIGLEIE